MISSLRLAKLSWISRTVDHSAGSPPILPDGSIPENETIYRVEFDGRVLIVNPSHLFYVVDKVDKQRKLVRVDRLYPSLYNLLSTDFNEIEIDSVWYGSYEGGVWGIGTDRSDTSVNAHLIGLNGVICGDYFLQTTYVEENLEIRDELLRLPQIGSAEFFIRETEYIRLS